jgi:hypothetical protein
MKDDTVVVAAVAAFGFYRRHGAYVCQGGRTFRDVRYVAFYRDKRIMPFIPLILDGSRYDADLHEVLVLTPESDERTVRLERAIRHPAATPFTRGHRYADIDALRRARTTTDLGGSRR